MTTPELTDDMTLDQARALLSLLAGEVKDLRAAADRAKQAAPAQDDEALKTCERCGGAGTISVMHGRGPDTYEADENCPACDGAGAHDAADRAKQAAPAVQADDDDEALLDKMLEALWAIEYHSDKDVMRALLLAVRAHDVKQAAPTFDEMLSDYAGEKQAAPDARYEACKREAQQWKQEAQTANATIAEIYQLCTGKTGEPGNWNGAQPVRDLIARLSGGVVQAAQEPVAWTWKFGSYSPRLEFYKPDEACVDKGTLRPLYTSPQPDTALLEEAKRAAKSLNDAGFTNAEARLRSAIEAAEQARSGDPA